MKKFIFDVDGTLTDSRQQIDLSFEPYMIKFCCKYDVYLVTGSDRAKTIEQLTPYLYIYNDLREYTTALVQMFMRKIIMSINLIGNHLQINQTF